MLVNGASKPDNQFLMIIVRVIVIIVIVIMIMIIITTLRKCGTKNHGCVRDSRETNSPEQLRTAALSVIRINKRPKQLDPLQRNEKAVRGWSAREVTACLIL